VVSSPDRRALGMADGRPLRVIETRAESHAVTLAGHELDQEGEWSSSDRLRFAEGWIAGRNWARAQLAEQILAHCKHYPRHGEGQADECLQIRSASGAVTSDDPVLDRALASGMRLMGCPHAASCRSTDECSRLTGGR
jgi:hypothetical protein